tara:strand:- start:178 stop:468 length:291 start_codon:yes stop_codon:yes gene_type:complete
MFSIISLNRYSVLLGRKIDFLYRLSAYEWQGTLEDGEFYILIECKGLLVQIDIQQREMFLGTSIKPVLSLKKPHTFNVFQCCEFFEWEYDPENIMN